MLMVERSQMFGAIYAHFTGFDYSHNHNQRPLQHTHTRILFKVFKKIQFYAPQTLLTSVCRIPRDQQL